MEKGGIFIPVVLKPLVGRKKGGIAVLISWHGQVRELNFRVRGDSFPLLPFILSTNI